MKNDKQKDYLSLNRLGQQYSFSLDYLQSMAFSGKLKAFKIDAEWYSSQQWLEDFICKIQSDIKGESQKDISDNMKWIGYLFEGSRSSRSFNYFIACILGVFLFVGASAFGLFILFLISFGGQTNIGYQFVKLTDNVYSYPVRFFSGEIITFSDEQITKKLHTVLGVKTAISGQVDEK